ncbi:MAG: prepilin-type N-terminal cleavage/methylation domain-containing protein [bacterium]|nr:hypothetical protein [Deltaproteobacteria bacterium]MCP4908682.1 prepilin-type N-terminal cleavage/methylation domain-containing protein [bacterium]
MQRATEHGARGRDKRNGGFTLIEAAIVIAIIGIVSATALPNVERYLESGRSRAAARSVADAFNVARARAIRTGNNHLVFFSIGGAGDAAGNPLQRQAGQPVPILILDDGAPGSADQNCEIDTGEKIIGFDAQEGVGWGANAPLSAQTPPDEQLPSIPAAGSSFQPPNSTVLTTPVSWVQFRPDGVPVAVDGSCNPGQLGSGGGTIYLWSTNRDFAITLSPLGGVRVHAWNASTGGWSS